MKVKLTYFKPSGKYYSEAEYETGVPDEVLVTGQTAPPLFKIWDEVGNMKQTKSLPDICNGHSDFTVLVNVPGHPHDHPRIIPGYNDGERELLYQTLVWRDAMLGYRTNTQQDAVLAGLVDSYRKANP